MPYDIITIGGPLVEIMRKEMDQPFDRAADFIGPYPSGDTPIFINAAARLGGNCAMIGVVGPDDFGRCFLNRMRENGVSTEMFRVQNGATTGTAFVCYYSNGKRSFIYHWRHSAAGLLDEQDVAPEKLAGAKWVHVTGVTISSSESSARAVKKLLTSMPKDTRLSFDPNIRPEVLSVEEIRALCGPVIERAEFVFPSVGEAAMLTGEPGDEAGCARWAGQGKTVVLKNGEKGCRIYDGQSVTDVPSYCVEEIDPTGAGDTFCGAFLVARLNGWPLAECGRFANAAGALSVTKKGPMEGAPTREEVLHMMKNGSIKQS